MKHLLFAFLILAGLGFGLCDHVTEMIKRPEFKSPESITYDSNTKCFVISNTGNGTLHVLTPDRKLKVLAEGYESFLGVTSKRGVVYTAENRKDANDRVHAFLINTGRKLFSIEVEGSKQLNDVALDNHDNLFVSDRMGNRIYRISLRDRTTDVIDSTIQTPNGLCFEGPSNSLLVCNTVKNSSIYMMAPDGSRKTEISKTQYPHFDGIALDKKARIYVTSWSEDWKSSQLLRYSDSTWTVIQENKNGMADIEINQIKNRINIANYWDNSVWFMPLD